MSRVLSNACKADTNIIKSINAEITSSFPKMPSNYLIQNLINNFKYLKIILKPLLKIIQHLKPHLKVHKQRNRPWNAANPHKQRILNYNKEEDTWARPV